MSKLGFTSDPEPSERGYYTVSGSTSALVPYLFAATRQDPQTADTECGDLSINNQGTKGESGTVADTSACW